MKKILALLLVVFLLPVVHADNIFIDLDWMIVKNDKNEFVWAPLKLIPAGDIMAAGISLECPPDEAGIPLRVGVRALEYLNITTHTYRSEKVREVPNDFDMAILRELPTLEMAHSFSPLYRVFTDKYENKDAKYLQPGERSDDFMIPPQDRVILTIPKERVISVHSDVSISSDNVSSVSSVSSMWNGKIKGGLWTDLSDHQRTSLICLSAVSLLGLAGLYVFNKWSETSKKKGENIRLRFGGRRNIRAGRKAAAARRKRMHYRLLQQHRRQRGIRTSYLMSY